MATRSLLATIAVALSPFAFTAAAQDAKPTAAPPPLAAFAKLPFMESPQLSPDGTRVAARIAVQGKLRLAIIPLGDSGKTALVDPGDYDLNSWSWVNDQWLVVRVGNMQPVEGDSWYVRRAFSVSADGAKINVLAMPGTGQNADDILWVARDGRPHILLAAQTSIYSDNAGFWPEVRDFDVSTGKSVRVQSAATNVMNWYADATGVVRLGIAYDDANRSYRALYRPGANAPFKTIARARKGDSLAPARADPAAIGQGDRDRRYRRL